MKTEAWLRKRVLSATLTMLVVAIILGVIVVDATSRRRMTTRPFQETAPLLGQQTIRKNRTYALQVVNTAIVNDLVKISLRNVSNKNVNGIQLSVNGSTFQIEFLDADEPSRQKLLPGSTYEEWFRVGNSSNSIEVVVLAVTFDDRTGDGDRSLLNEITETRLGVKKQLMRFRPLLDNALSSPDVDSLTILDELKSKVDDLPDEDSADSGPMKMGQHKAKEQIRYEIETLKRTLLNKRGVVTRQALTDIKNKHDKRIQDLEKPLN